MAGYMLGFIFSKFKKNKLKAEFISLVRFQNAGYLPMNIAFFLFRPEIRDKFLVYIFLYLLGFNILMWSLGSFFIFKKRGERFKFRSVFTPPVTGTILALILIYLRAAQFIPEIIIAPLRMIGQISFVLSMVILGCWLAKVKLDSLKVQLPLVALASLLKLIVLPFIFLGLTIIFNVYSLLGAFIVLQAAMPAAASLPIIAHRKGANSEFVSQAVFFMHIAGIITIPVWLSIYLAISGISF